ncbi:hypothetical protein KFE25_003886 [Diacronema lutheri]|uniref:Histone acetyltransferase n=1 Tax=Diacronema lutheri TaxID=2081491 RepID=A0A8J6CDJ9_DIALT|nr:hypothetical protein KFE25_003886 [Diacronema lutheri]
MGVPSTSHKPLEIGCKLLCRWRDEQYWMCEVIERRHNLETSEWQYYVHYLSFNRRMDEWVGIERFDLGAQETSGGDGKKVTRNIKRKFDESHHAEEEGELDPVTLREHEEATKVKNINRIAIGKYEMNTWYFSPFPKEYANCDTLYWCEYDLAYFARREHLERYVRTRCKRRHPPGDEIFRQGEMAVYEIDSRVERVFCENLCLLAKLFLDHKTLYFDVQPFLFYAICTCDDQGAHIVGYFSKERVSAEDYNLACILTLPCYQRRGYGKFMISISYELSKREKKLGTPERPLSDLGLVSYRSYWATKMLEILCKHKGTISIQELSDMTFFRPEDIISTLQALDLLKYFGGQHSIYVSPKMVEQYVNKKDNSPPVDPARLQWTPHSERRGNGAMTEGRKPS